MATEPEEAKELDDEDTPLRITSVELTAYDDIEDEDDTRTNYVSIELTDGYVYHFDAYKIPDLASFAEHM